MTQWGPPPCVRRRCGATVPSRRDVTSVGSVRGDPRWGLPGRLELERTPFGRPRSRSRDQPRGHRRRRPGRPSRGVLDFGRRLAGRWPRRSPGLLAPCPDCRPARPGAERWLQRPRRPPVSRRGAGRGRGDGCGRHRSRRRPELFTPRPPRGGDGDRIPGWRPCRLRGRRRGGAPPWGTLDVGAHWSPSTVRRSRLRPRANAVSRLASVIRLALDVSDPHARRRAEQRYRAAFSLRRARQRQAARRCRAAAAASHARAGRGAAAGACPRPLPPGDQPGLVRLVAGAGAAGGPPGRGRAGPGHGQPAAETPPPRCGRGAGAG